MLVTNGRSGWPMNAVLVYFRHVSVVSVISGLTDLWRWKDYVPSKHRVHITPWLSVICQRNGIHMFPLLESVERTSTKKTGPKKWLDFCELGKGSWSSMKMENFLKSQRLVFWEGDVQRLRMIGAICLLILHSFAAWIRTFTFTSTNISWKYHHDIHIWELKKIVWSFSPLSSSSSSFWSSRNWPACYSSRVLDPSCAQCFNFRRNLSLCMVSKCLSQLSIVFQFLSIILLTRCCYCPSKCI